jgi:hypothetical protein
MEASQSELLQQLYETDSRRLSGRARTEFSALVSRDGLVNEHFARSLVQRPTNERGAIGTEGLRHSVDEGEGFRINADGRYAFRGHDNTMSCDVLEVANR